METAKDCLFCKIIRKEIPAEVVFEDEAAIAFLDIHPKAPGHTMVVPKVHAETILELPKASLGPIFHAVKEVTGGIKSVFNPEGFTIGWNHGRKAGQTVDHLHIHIIPRFDGDGGGSIHAVVDNPPQEPLQEIGEKIRNIWK